jgi:hypothetical protein
MLARFQKNDNLASASGAQSDALVALPNLFAKRQKMLLRKGRRRDTRLSYSGSFPAFVVGKHAKHFRRSIRASRDF